MGASMSGSPKFVLPNGQKNFNMTGAVSMQCLQQPQQNSHHFNHSHNHGQPSKSNANHRRLSAHASTSDLPLARDANNNNNSNNNNSNSSNNNNNSSSSNGNSVPQGGKAASSRTHTVAASATDREQNVPTLSVTGLGTKQQQPQQHRYQYNQNAAASNRTQSMYGAFHAEPIKPSKSMASLKDTSRSTYGQLGNDGVVGLPALKPKLTVSPTSTRPLRPHSHSQSQSQSQTMNASLSMSQLKATQPAVTNGNGIGLQGTLALATKRVSSTFGRKSTAKQASSRHGRSVTADGGVAATPGGNAADGAKSGGSNGLSLNAVGVRTSLHVSQGEKHEKENNHGNGHGQAHENAPSHNYRQPIPKAVSCYNIKSQHSYSSGDNEANGSGNGSGSSSGNGHATSHSEGKSQRKTVLQASTTELLQYLSEYLYRQSPQLHSSFKPADAIVWIRSADKNLILQGWSDINFVNPANVVFVFMLLRNVVDYRTIRTVNELHALTMTCLYLAYAYMGNEISYPLKPFFLGSDDRDSFWQRCVDIINVKSTAMLRLNTDPTYFAETFAELKGYALTLANANAGTGAGASAS